MDLTRVSTVFPAEFTDFFKSIIVLLNEAIYDLCTYILYM